MCEISVSTLSRLKAAGDNDVFCFEFNFVSTHSRLKAAGFAFGLFGERGDVSTHSRLKAAGVMFKSAPTLAMCFNTQPPEGGWPIRRSRAMWSSGFNTQPPEGGWAAGFNQAANSAVSTHSRLKAAG